MHTSPIHLFDLTELFYWQFEMEHGMALRRFAFYGARRRLQSWFSFRFTCACSSRLIDGYDWWALPQLAARSLVRLFVWERSSPPLSFSFSISPACRQKPNSMAAALLIYIRTKMCCRPNWYNWTFYSLFIGHSLSLYLSLSCSSASQSGSRTAWNAFSPISTF